MIFSDVVSLGILRVNRFLIYQQSYDFPIIVTHLDIKMLSVSVYSLIRCQMLNMLSHTKTCFSYKLVYRSNLNLFLKGKADKEIHSKLTSVYESSAPLKA